MISGQGGAKFSCFISGSFFRASSRFLSARSRRQNQGIRLETRPISASVNPNTLATSRTAIRGLKQT